MPRTSHKKSRLGCRVCKQRKVKCDETRPACRKCATGRRECSYSLPLPSLPTPASSVNLDNNKTGRSAERDPAASGFPEAGSTPDRHATVPASPDADARFSLIHLQLLEHARTEMTASMQDVQPACSQWLHLGFAEALRHPYLMDQLLALAAAHKSTTVKADVAAEAFYRAESTRLQTRALSRVDLRRGGSLADVADEESSLALFAYATLLGQHVFIDIFHGPDDASFSATLDKLAQCVDLHQGIRAVSSQCWARLHRTLGAEPAHQRFLMLSPELHTEGTECSDLLVRLESSGLEQPTLGVYCNAVQILQYLFDSLGTSAQDRRIVVIQEWLVRVPHSFTAHIRQRRAEALVILSYYGVLLHKAKAFWVIGDSGRFVIQSIASYLGEYWADWMTWPQAALRDG